METSNLIKYQSKNLIQQALIKRFQNRVVRLVSKKRIKSVADIGCGEGFGLKNLASNNVGKTHVGLDYSETALMYARKINPAFKYVRGSIYKTPFKDGEFDLVICSEVLEHLEKPEEAIIELKRISNKYILISVPYEPWFRIFNFLRGKYTKSWGNHPEHINWWGKKSLKELLSRHLKVRNHITSIPWQIALSEV